MVQGFMGINFFLSWIKKRNANSKLLNFIRFRKEIIYFTWWYFIQFLLNCTKTIKVSLIRIFNKLLFTFFNITKWRLNLFFKKVLFIYSFWKIFIYIWTSEFIIQYISTTYGTKDTTRFSVDLSCYWIRNQLWERQHWVHHW